MGLLSALSPGSLRLRAARGGAAASAAAPAAAATTRRAWSLEAGSVASLELRETPPLPPAGAGEVLIKVAAVGLNFADVFSVLGLYSATPDSRFTPGLEFSGEILEVGAGPATYVEFAGPEAKEAAERDARKFRVGDRVSGVVRFGAYATHVLVPAHQLRKVPTSWTFEQAAALNVQGLTSFYGLKALGGLRKGDTVLVHSAAGGCGLLALAICEAVGATAIGTVGAASKVSVILERFPRMDPARVIVRDRKGFQGQLDAALEAVGAEGFDIVLDAVLGDYFPAGWASLAKGGRYVTYGAADMTPQGDSVWSVLSFAWLKLAWKYLTRPKVDPLAMMAENRGILGFNLIWMFSKVSLLAPLLEELYALKLAPPHVGHVFAFEEAPEAIRLFQSGRTTGKVVLKLP